MKKLILILTVVIGLSSCTEKVNIDLSEFNFKPVVEGNISTETDSSYVKLSYTKDYFDKGDFKKIEHVTVTVTKNEDSSWVFVHTSDGFYKCPAGFRGVPGNTYHLRFAIDGKEYTASSKLQEMFELEDTLSQKYYPASGLLGLEGFAVIYYSRDNRPDPGYTQFSITSNVEPEPFVFYFDTELSEKGKLVPFEIPIFRFQSGDTIDMTFKSLDPNVSAYLQALNNLDSGIPGPFQSPPANPPSNIRNGGLGYFSAFDIVRRRKIID